MYLLEPEAVAADTAAVLTCIAATLRPAPEMKISEWADGRINVPGETGTERPGPLSWEGFEELVEPLDLLHPDEPCRDVTFLGSAQIAKTFVGQVATYYYSSEVPRPWGVALPSTDEVLKYNRAKWQPVVDATPELRRKVKPVSSRDEQGSTNTYKRFAGGAGMLFATGSPKALQMVTFCLVVYEETPNWEREVGGRGDPRSQIRKRQLRWERAGAKTYHNATPGIVRAPDGQDEEAEAELVGCPITEDFLLGDQRQRYHPCPECGDDDQGIWLRLDYEQMKGLAYGERPHFVCPGCGTVIEHRHKMQMKARGVWLPTYPSEDPTNPAPDWYVRKCEIDGYRARRYPNAEGREPSFCAWQVVSSAVDWDWIAGEHRKAEVGSEAVKIAFSQQVLGRAYHLKLDKADIQELLDKRDRRLTRGVVPAGFYLLTGAVDLNGDWAQWTVYAWGPEFEHVVVDKGRIDGTPSDPRLWREMAALVSKRFAHEEGGQVGVESWGIDSGYGTLYVYAFCNRYSHVKALDGVKDWNQMPLRRGERQKLQSEDGTQVVCRIWKVGTWDLKRELYDTIALSTGLDAGRHPRKCHWPAWLERDYFEELTAEVLVEVQDSKTGIVKDQRWARVRRRNEEMDLWVYNAAQARAKGVGLPGSEPDWLDLRRRIQAQPTLDDLWERPPHEKAAGSAGEAPARAPLALPAATPTDEEAAAAADLDALWAAVNEDS